MTVPFRNRSDAGRKLARKVNQYSGKTDVIVLALPRGGVPVAFEVARALSVPMDVFLVRKLGVPGRKELAMGAIASNGVRILNKEVVEMLSISRETIDQITRKEQFELERREKLYRDNRPQPPVKGRHAVLVDDGLATGASMWAAVAALRTLEPSRISVAVPVAPPETCMAFQQEVDEIICVITPSSFGGVGAWYKDFTQTSDQEVREFLNQSNIRTRVSDDI